MRSHFAQVQGEFCSFFYYLAFDKNRVRKFLVKERDQYSVFALQEYRPQESGGRLKGILATLHVFFNLLTTMETLMV